MNKLAVVAIGGNSLILDPKQPDVQHQWDAVRETCRHLASMIEAGWQIVITHGNGPQVGYILRRNELASHEVHSTPFDLIVADTQGAIGYMLQQALSNELLSRGRRAQIATVVTQVRVDADDPGFRNPTKPIGGFLTPEQAEACRKEGWQVIEDAGRGLRRVVASPQPLEVMELPAIQSLLGQGFIVIAVGGGGVPVLINPRGELRGAFAVIDKDRASALLAASLKADLLLISTGVAQVAIRFNTPQQQNLAHMTLVEAKRYMEEGHFAPGSMRPKIEAAIRFLEAGGQEVLVTSPEHIAAAVAGNTGTRITKE